MKRILALMLAALLLTFCLAGCAEKPAPAPTEAPAPAPTEAPAPAPTEAPAIPEPVKKTFTVGFDAEFPPFGFIDAEGGYDGFDLAVAEEVCKRLDWDFIAQPIAWEAKDAELSAGTIDCIWNGFTYNGRESDYSWSPAYYDNSVVMVVKADSDIQTLADLAGRNVITQAGSSALTALEGNAELSGAFAELLECADFNMAFAELGMGTADAVAADIGVANYNMAGKEADYRILDETVSSETYAIGFLLGNDALAAEVWAAVEEIAADGTMSALADRYIEFGLVKESLTLLYR